MSGIGPTPPTWALQQAGSYLGYTGRDANILAEAAYGSKEDGTHVVAGDLGTA
jgi:hypothetical protein